MEKKYDALLIQELNLDEDTSRRYAIYTVNIKYKDLIKIAKIRDISTNRSVDSTRIAKMKEFITKNSSFYPPLILSTSKREILKYDSQNKQIKFSIIEGTEDELIIIDGQHRLKSIEKLMLDEEVSLELEERIQNVIIIDYISDRKRREVFVEINDNSKRVATAVKERFKINISNYISLLILKKSTDLIQRIEMDKNQTSSFKNFPYKIICKSNDIFLKELNKTYQNEELKIEEIEKFEEVFKILWDLIIERFKKLPEDSSLIVNEAVYLEIFNTYKDKFKEIYEIEDKMIKITKVKKDSFIEAFSKGLDKLSGDNDNLGKELIKAKTIGEKRIMIKNKLGEV